ncbi:MAG: hypothetical protein Q9M16_05230 [Mariprofundus sp.]|nr:hypothetical protein [Mariprofundus sp.]
MFVRHCIYSVVVLFVSACASHAPIDSTDIKLTAFWVNQSAGQIENLNNHLASRFAPIIVPDQPQVSYNRVGKPVAAYNEDGEEQISVSAEQPVFYFQQRDFSTDQASYTNLIYRMHFEGTPFYHLTSGDNVGLFVIVTINAQKHPVLITTVHTCGCYLAFTPTQYMPADAFPKHWDETGQQVYGQSLPSLLQWSGNDARPIIMLEDGTHRVRDIQIISTAHAKSAMHQADTAIEAMAALKRLPLGSGNTSFFITEGDDKGYVKGSNKPWEFLFMSWWALDINIGVDKDYGDASKTGVLFYTDLNPKNREASDMWPFARFLHYWGWRL